MPDRNLRIRSLVAAVLAATAVAASASPARAQRLATRTDLLAYLGASAVTETFEQIAIPTSGTLAFGQEPVLGAATSRPGLPAGSIAEGLTFRNPNQSHSFHAPAFGLRSQAYSGGSTELDIGFTAGTRAVGFDLMNFSFINPQPGTVSFFSGAGTLLGRIDLVLRDGGYAFLGWRSDDADIARVHLSGFYPTGASSPNIDDVTFEARASTPVVTPEPATVALLAGGLATLGAIAVRRRRAA